VISLDNNTPYEGTFYLQASAAINKEVLPINLLICGYEKVTGKVLEMNLRYSKEDIKQFVDFKGYFKTNHTFCGIASYKLVGENKYVYLDGETIVVVPQGTDNDYQTENLELELQAFSDGDQSFTTIVYLELIAKINPADLAKLVNYGPHLKSPRPFVQKTYYPDVTGKTSEYITMLDIIDNEGDRADYIEVNSVKKSGETISPPPFVTFPCYE
jgi:hypothetical protein